MYFSLIIQRSSLISIMWGMYMVPLEILRFVSVMYMYKYICIFALDTNIHSSFVSFILSNWYLFIYGFLFLILSFFFVLSVYLCFLIRSVLYVFIYRNFSSKQTRRTRQTRQIYIKVEWNP